MLQSSNACGLPSDEGSGFPRCLPSDEGSGFPRLPSDEGSGFPHDALGAFFTAPVFPRMREVDFLSFTRIGLLTSAGLPSDEGSGFPRHKHIQDNIHNTSSLG